MKPGTYIKHAFKNDGCTMYVHKYKCTYTTYCKWLLLLLITRFHIYQKYDWLVNISDTSGILMLLHTT